MASLIHELENNEALLLMYLTDELPAEDRLEVEQMLAGDGGMRAELLRIQSGYEMACVSLKKLDADRTAHPAENHAIRQAMRAMKQWQVDQLSRQPVFVPTARAKIPFWVYPAASVAALLIGTIAWWGFGGEFNLGKGASESHLTASTADGATLSSDDVTANRLVTSLANDVPAIEQPNGIADAEIQANSLADRSDGSWVASPLFLTEANP